MGERADGDRRQSAYKLSLNLSFLDVGPWRVVPLMERTTVELSEERKTCPRKPSSESCQPNGKLCQ